MTATDITPVFRLDRYLALLAVLMALVLGLLVIGERQKQPPLPAPVVGTLPPLPDPRLSAVMSERQTLTAERARLAMELSAAQEQLTRAEMEAATLRQENERLQQLLGEEGQALKDMAGRLAEVESERDRLSAEVAALNDSRAHLETRIAALEAERLPPASPVATAPDSFASPMPGSGLAAALAELGRDQGAPAIVVDRPLPVDQPTTAAGPFDPRPEPTLNTPESEETLHRLTTFNSNGASTSEGIAAYQAGDYRASERIWGALAAAGDSRAQFHFGSQLFEGRTAPPDRVMAYVWLTRSIHGGFLPAIEMRRRVRRAMTETEYAEALALEEGIGS